jgi:hypothetical protein
MTKTIINKINSIGDAPVLDPTCERLGVKFPLPTRHEHVGYLNHRLISKINPAFISNKWQTDVDFSKIK